MREYFQASSVQLADWPKELGIPIINTEISTARLIDRLDDGELQVPIDADGRVSLWQTGQLFSIQANEIVSFPDTGNSLTIPGLIVLASPVRTTEQYAFNAPNGMKVEHLDLRSGEAYLRLSSAFSKPGNVRVEIPALSNGVTSYDETLAFDTSSGGVLSVTEKVVDISGYSFDFTQATPAYNRFNYDITLSMDGALPKFSDSLILEFGYRNLSFTFMDGDFGQQIVSLDEDSIFMPLFDAFGEGSVLFNDLEFEFEIINSFGFPVDIDFEAGSSRRRVQKSNNLGPEWNCGLFSTTLQPRLPCLRRLRSLRDHHLGHEPRKFQHQRPHRRQAEMALPPD